MLLMLAAEQQAHDPLGTFIGAFDSGGADWSDLHGSHLGQAALDNSADTL